MAPQRVPPVEGNRREAPAGGGGRQRKPKRQRTAEGRPGRRFLRVSPEAPREPRPDPAVSERPRLANGPAGGGSGSGREGTALVLRRVLDAAGMAPHPGPPGHGRGMGAVVAEAAGGVPGARPTREQRKRRRRRGRLRRTIREPQLSAPGGGTRPVPGRRERREGADGGLRRGQRGGPGGAGARPKRCRRDRSHVQRPGGRGTPPPVPGRPLARGPEAPRRLLDPRRVREQRPIGRLSPVRLALQPVGPGSNAPLGHGPGLRGGNDGDGPGRDRPTPSLRRRRRHEGQPPRTTGTLRRPGLCPFRGVDAGSCRPPGERSHRRRRRFFVSRGLLPALVVAAVGPAGVAARGDWFLVVVGGFRRGLPGSAVGGSHQAGDFRIRRPDEVLLVVERDDAAKGPPGPGQPGRGLPSNSDHGLCRRVVRGGSTTRQATATTGQTVNEEEQ
mmetsp:Transcript_9808/g.22353  ORF Transcript_9808/g.22353 Transcript_9808/m.22353 type:complete len:444 (-) Transcript_9808:122-1453(-)